MSWAVQRDAVDVIYTDQLKSYRIFDGVYEHERINHSLCFIDGDIHTNGIEGFWSLLKRGINGAFHHVSAKHLSLYLDEFMWRFNNRKEDKIFEALLKRCGNGQLAYRVLTA